MNLKALLLAFVAAAIAAVALPGVAQAGFSSNELDVSGGAGNNEVVASAVDQDGNALVAWTEAEAPAASSKKLLLRRIRPDGSMGSIIEGAPIGNRVDGVKILFDSNGRALVGYWGSTAALSSQYLNAFWVGPNDQPTPTITIAGGNENSSVPEDVAMAITSANDAVFAWRNNSSTISQNAKIQARRFLANSTLATQLVPVSASGNQSVKLAPDSTGGALLAWRHDADINFQRVNPDNTLGPGLYTQVTTAGAGPELASDGDNAFQALFRVGGGPQSLQTRTLDNTGHSYQATVLSPDGSANDAISSFDVATNPDSLSLTAWSRGDGLGVGTGDIVGARFINPDRTLQPGTLSAPVPAENQTAPQVAIDAAGDGALVWRQSSPTTPKTNWGRIFPAGGTPSDPVRLSKSDVDTGAPLVELGSNGVGVATWARSDGTPSTVVARQIIPAPVCQPTSGTVVQGQPIIIDLTCVGLQLIDPEIVSDPAHGTVKPVGNKAQQFTYTPAPGYAGPDQFTFRGANPGGTSDTAAVALNVGKDTVQPSVTKLTIKPRKFRYSKKTLKRKKATVGVTFSEPSTAVLKIERKAGKKFRKFASLKVTALAVSANLKLKGKIGSKKIKPGKYRVTAVATDAAGNQSAARRTGFKVVRARSGK